MANNVRETLREFWRRLRHRIRKGADARRVDEARTRFWAEVREGEREAEASSGN